jgi:hypothetical protein
MDWTLDLCFTKDFACVTTPSRASRRGFLKAANSAPMSGRLCNDDARSAAL